jgi:hypothetical protein
MEFYLCENLIQPEAALTNQGMNNGRTLFALPTGCEGIHRGKEHMGRNRTLNRVAGCIEQLPARD